MTNNTTPKTLTNDEKKAADAAFAGRPFNPVWSASARVIYDGIVDALPKDVVAALPEVEAVLADLEAKLPAVSGVGNETPTDRDSKQEGTAADSTAGPGVPTISRMLKKSASGVLASLRGSTYGTKYDSPLRSLRPCGTAFLSILRGCLVSPHTSQFAMASGVKIGFSAAC